jgi:hypothetical protein
MPNHNSTYAQAQADAATKRASQPSGIDAQLTQRRAVLSYTWKGTEVNGDTITLGALNLSNVRLHAEDCRVRASAASTLTGKLQSFTATAVDLSTAASTLSASQTGAFVAPAGVLAKVPREASIRFLLTGAPTVTAGTIIEFDLGFSATV